MSKRQSAPLPRPSRRRICPGRPVHTGARFSLARILTVGLALLTLSSSCRAASTSGDTASTANTTTVILTGGPDEGSIQHLAEHEIRRYFYLRTGALASFETALPLAGQAIVVSTKDGPLVTGDLVVRGESQGLGPEQFLLKTTHNDGITAVWIVGGDKMGALYGAYRLAEILGVRFYLSGDVLPDEQISPTLPDLDETDRPLFSTRGILSEEGRAGGPDWWRPDDYLAILSQLPSLRMNFFGLSPAQEGMPGQQSGEAASRGALKTADFSGGASLLFDTDAAGPDETSVRPSSDSARLNLNNAFSSARALGMKTAIGAEIPAGLMTGTAPTGPSITPGMTDESHQATYASLFGRIARTYPLDYYCLWTPEEMSGAAKSEPAAVQSAVEGIQAASRAWKAAEPPFQLAAIASDSNTALSLNQALPSNLPLGVLDAPDIPFDRRLGSITARPKWAILSLEDVTRPLVPPFHVGRIRYDSADAYRLGCAGLIGMQWRTRVISAAISAMAAASWDRSIAPLSPDERMPESWSAGAVGGEELKSSAPVAGTDLQAVYQTVRTGMEAYNLPLPNGDYTVTLQFNEPVNNAPGKRVFSVRLQGKTVIESLDLFRAAGKDRALDYHFPVRVNEKWLRIQFLKQLGEPCIAGIVIQGQAESGGVPYRRRINCGGGATHDYEPDLVLQTRVGRERSLPQENFYIDFARANFGENLAEPAGKILSHIDAEGLPGPEAVDGNTGVIRADRTPWAEVKKKYAFVEEMAALRPQIQGAGSLERLDYWLNSYQFLEAAAQLGCLRGQLDVDMEKLAAANEASQRGALAKTALDVRLQLAREWERMMSLATSTADTPGALGAIAALEEQNQALLTEHDHNLAAALGAPLPDNASPSAAYSGPSRILVPTVRSRMSRGEALKLKVIIVDAEAPEMAALYWRPLGQGSFQKVELQHLTRAVYSVTLPPATADFEYFILARTVARQLIFWPMAAPDLSQTVIVTSPFASHPGQAPPE